ncbi:MAG: hypothetical protein JST40_05205 [Armatimonadetes bacterium]|nr:hypothetical protein [Armatimonadota bacterium]
MKRLLIFGISIALCAGANAQKNVQISKPFLEAAELGPAPMDSGDTGRVSAIACSRQNANLVYVGGADGGVWKTTNGGTTWSWVTPSLPTTAVGALAIDPSNDQILYVGTGEANFANHSRYGMGIFKTTNGGVSWVQLGANVFSGRCISRLVIDPSNKQRLFASVTTAGGFPELAAAKNHPNATGPLGVFRSTDGGETWTQLTNGLPSQTATDVAIDPSNPQVLYAGIGRIFGSTQNGIYKSADGGNTWSKLAGGLPTSSVGRITLCVAPSLSSRVYAMIARSCDASGGNGTTLGAYRTDNSGTSWTTLNVGSIQATYGWYLNTIAVQPTNPNTVLFGGYTCSRSTNSGSTFSDVTPPHVDLHAFDWDASGNLWCGNDGGVHRSTNLGTSWSYRNAGLGTIQFYAGISKGPNGTSLAIGGQQDNGTSYRSGSNWIFSIGGDGGYTAIDQNNQLRMFGEYQGSGTLFRTTNGGGGFSGVGSGIGGSDRTAFFCPYVIDPSNSNRMLYGTQYIYQSTNGGTSFSKISADITAGSGAVRSIAIAKSNSQRVYITTTDGLVRTSSNGGVSFTTIRTQAGGFPRIMREIWIDPSNDQHVLLAVPFFGSERLLESVNAGATWQQIGVNLPDIPVNTVVVFGSVFAVGTDAGVYYSANQGSSWKKADFPNVPVIDMIWDASTRKVLVATQGRGMWLWAPTPSGVRVPSTPGN